METSFHKKFGTELPRLEYCRKRKLATTPKPQTSGPRESTKNIYKNQAARPLKNRAAGTAVHSLPSSAEAWHVHSHPKTISRHVEVFGGSEKTSETRTPTPTQGTAERKCKKGAIACFRCAITSLLELRGNILKHHCREIVHHGRPHRPNLRIF